MSHNEAPDSSRDLSSDEVAAEPRRVDREAFAREFPTGDPTATECAQNLMRTSDLFTAADSRAMRNLGVSIPGRILLATLEGAGKPLPHSELAEKLFVTGASVTSLVDTLERKGLVRRVRDDADRRVVLVELTDAAYPLLDTFLSQVTALHAAEFAVLDEDERSTLNELLAKVAAGIQQVDTESIAATAQPRRVPPALRAQRP